MTHICYVRSSAGRLLEAPVFRTLKSRVMPARLLMTGTLLIWSCLALSQQFLVAGCDSTCQPAFSTIPEDIVVDCLADLPAFDLPATEGCGGAPVASVPHVELNEDVITTYDLGTAYGPGDDWALWLGNFEAMGLGASDHFVPDASGVELNLYANGTARITGRVVNDTDASQQFDLDLFLQYGQDYGAWSAQGRFPKDDLGLMAYVDWTFFEMVDTLSRIEGAGAFDGDVLYLDHMPVSRAFGFQLGANGANNRNTNFGISGWFWYRGVMNGAPITGTGDVNADLTNASVQAVSCPVVESVERHAMAWSACGHHAISYSVERHDLEAPTFVSLPPLASADCTSLPDTADFSEFVVTDDCGSDLSLEVLSDLVDGVPCNQQLTRTWRLTDACGNSTDTFQVVTLVDTTGPEFQVPDTTIACDDWDAFEPIDITPTDACSPADSITWTFADSVTSGIYPYQFTLDRVYSATDLCGNTTTDTMVISVIDTVAPTWTYLPPDTTILCDQWEDYLIIQPIATDNCDPNVETPEGEGASDTTIIEGECIGEFLVFLTFELEDESGNTITYVQEIEAVDSIPPTFVYFPEDTVLSCEGSWPQPTDSAIWMATAEDNFCPFGVSWNDSIAPGDCPGDSVLYRTFTAIDDCDNITTQVQTISIVDTLGPVLSMVPEDTLIACGADLPTGLPVAMDACSAVDSLWTTVDTLDVEFGDPFLADFESCSLDGFVAEGGTISISNDAADGSCAVSMLHFAGDDPHNFYPADVLAGRGVYRVMARADNFISDNGIELLAGDGVSDNGIGVSLRPNGTDNPGISITGFGLNATADAVMEQGEWYEVEVVLGETLLELSIDGADVLSVLLPEDLPAAGRVKLWSAYAGSYDNFSYQPENPCPVVERYRRNFHAVDLCGNESTAFQIVGVLDTVAPVLENLPADTLIACGDMLPDHGVTAFDACSDADVITVVDTLSITCPGTFTLLRTFTATDGCSNAAQAQQTIEVVDTVAPTTAPLAEVTILCDEALPVELPTATDACSNPVTVELLSVDSVAGDCPQAWEVTRTFVATDACGNAGFSSQMIHVVDTIAPVLVLGLDTVTLECGSPLPVNLPSYADACDIMVNVMELVPDTMAGDCPGEYAVTRHFEAMDACGNTSTSSQTVLFIDTDAPAFDNVPGPVTIECDMDLPTELPLGLDDCSGPVDVVLFAVDSVAGDCPQAWEVTRTFRATDACGNQADTTQLVTIVDTTAPVIDTTTVPEPAFYSCSVEHPTCADFDVLAFDNCGGTDVNCTVDTLFTDCPATFTLEMTFTAIDECDNDASMTVQFDVADTTAPVLNLDLAPVNDTIQCTLDYPDLFGTSAFAVEDDCSEWTLGASREVVGDEETPCDYVLIDTYTFTDCNGNETVFVHTRTVIDSEGPNLPTSVVDDEDYYCAFEVPEFAMPITASMLADDDYPFDAVSDNCAAQDEILIDYSDSILVNNGPNNYTVQRTWTLTDHCDNKTEVVQVIIVAEPELIMPNAFSPGNNNINDRFVIEGLGIVDDGADEVYPPCDWGPDDQQHFMVFNRWGSEVYSLPPGEPYRNDWNGRNNDDEPLVDGTYFVLLRLGDRKLGQYVDLRNDK